MLSLERNMSGMRRYHEVDGEARRMSESIYVDSYAIQASDIEAADGGS